MNVTVTLRKWGNSLGAVFPKELVRAEKLREGQTLTLCLLKDVDLSHVFGTLPRKMGGQEFKDGAKKGWT